MADQKKRFPEETFENEKGVLRIVPHLCKGCRICIEFCPAKVLTLDKKRLVATASAMEKCIACGLCELRCPDFAIFIEKKEKKTK